MQSDTTADSGWAFVADCEAVPTLFETILELDPDETYTRSELAAETGIPLKTLHLMDDVDQLADMGVLEKHDPEGGEVAYSVNEENQILVAARAFDEAIAGHRD